MDALSMLWNVPHSNAVEIVLIKRNSSVLDISTVLKTNVK